MSSKPKVAIIGCGPSGMFTIAAFVRAQRTGEEIGEIVCFEKQDTMGGLWNYTWRTGTDGYGEPLHSSMYQCLWSNSPKELLEMGDYTFEEHFGTPIPSYPPREVISDFLMGKAKKYDASKHVRFSTTVRSVDEEGDQFLVTSQNLKTQRSMKEIFDYVIVATGHFSVPFLPSYPGLDDFKGQFIHSHDLRNASVYKGMSLLIIGNGYSGEDIALQSYKFGAKECVISYRTEAVGFNWPDGVREVPQLVKFEDDLFHFVDGSSFRADAVIFCTGYLNHYPFMFDNGRLQTSNSFYPDNLYKGVVYKNNTRVLYLGSQNQYFSFPMFDVQAYWACDYILGKINVKSAEERSAHIKEWRERFLQLKNPMETIIFQSDYISDLMSDTDYPDHGHSQRVAMFKEWKESRAEDIMTYRDKSYRSTVTGVLSPSLDTKWAEAVDSSVKTYISSIVA